MTESPRIHPVADVEAPPTIPSVQNGSIRGENPPTPSKPGTAQANMPNQPPTPPKPVTMQAVLRPAMAPSGPPPVAPPVRPLPIPPKKRTSSCTCCRCICCTLVLVLTILVAIAITGLILYTVFKPKIPTYSTDRLRITDFRLNTDLSLYARFNVRITANNPNEKIGIYYEKGGEISVLYTDTELCSGKIPVFYQGHRNKTVLDVDLTGQNQLGSTVISALQQQQQSGNVPLNLKVNAPVAVKFGGLKLRKVRFLIRCLLVVDSLSSNNLALNCKSVACSISIHQSTTAQWLFTPAFSNSFPPCQALYIGKPQQHNTDLLSRMYTQSSTI